MNQKRNKKTIELVQDMKLIVRELENKVLTVKQEAIIYSLRCMLKALEYDLT